MKRERKVYENGYWPKIEYWTGLLKQAIKESDSQGAALCSTKLEYFAGRQMELEDNLKDVEKNNIFFIYICNKYN